MRPVLCEEKQLLKEVAAGNEQSFRQLFQHWQAFLSTHVYRITESRELTEEIVQDVFLKIWQTRETLTSIHNFKGYLLVVSRNHTLNALQKKAREFSNQENWARENSNVEVGAEPESSYYTLIDEAIDQLPERQQQVYLLHRHYRLTYREIADRLGIGRETVKTHLGLAVRHISFYISAKIIVSALILFLLF